ncbi:MAG: haloalkane dehalogenase [Candidatus Poseidoniia archaeon]|jgi:haloalkane dehalogenase|nr:haloalkane dehalogenase [Candidatus Poseidoniia archaeon]HJL81090.1 haloalkane dehalogenase [Gammaproteobacteria bacterium]HJP42098.1 haloalkane dehalogenase [Gammaproteobacteria bacterium]|tara:strand:- start:2536 stop:3621 length:1086 start_codon:yes stop_codon:yes gene_type:complete
MKILRTPDARFKNLKEYPFEPHYTTIKTHDDSDLRIHHLDEGPKDGPILLAMHGQPVWSYLYARMIPFLTKAGIRVIAPDLPGYGKSDKPALREDYSYQRQVDWMSQWLKENDFSDLTFFGQDWGGLIGLRMIAQDPDRFSKVSMGNTGLPYNPDTPQEVIDEVKAFRQSDLKLTPISMAKEVRQMDGRSLSKESDVKFHPALKFMYWQKFCWETENLPIGFMNSNMMEKRSKYSLMTQYFFHRVGFEKLSPCTSDLVKAYEAPFPDPSYKMGPRSMPSQVPIIPDASLEAQREAREFFKTTTKPFLSVFAGDDPITNGIEKDVIEMAPNAKSAPHIGGGHFYQWTKAKKLSDILISFIKE